MSPAPHALLIEDDDTFQIIHSKLLQVSGLVSQVTIAKNGQEGITSILNCTSLKNIPALIFVDLDMPVMNGFQFLEALKRLDPDLRRRMFVAVLTSSVNRDDRSNAMHLGADCYLEKPLSIQDLENQLLSSDRFHPVENLKFSEIVKRQSGN